MYLDDGGMDVKIDRTVRSSNNCDWDFGGRIGVGVEFWDGLVENWGSESNFGWIRLPWAGRRAVSARAEGSGSKTGLQMPLQRPTYHTD